MRWKIVEAETFPKLKREVKLDLSLSKDGVEEKSKLEVSHGHLKQSAKILQGRRNWQAWFDCESWYRQRTCLKKMARNISHMMVKQAGASLSINLETPEIEC